MDERKERGREHIQLLMQLDGEVEQGSEEQGSSQCGLGYRTKPHLLEICGNGWGLGGPLQTFQGSQASCPQGHLPEVVREAHRAGHENKLERDKGPNVLLAQTTSLSHSREVGVSPLLCSLGLGSKK